MLPTEHFYLYYKQSWIARNRAAVLNYYAHPRAVRDVCTLADYRAPDGGVPHAAAPGDEADFTCGMTAKEDKKTPARVGRVPGHILAQRWGRPSLASDVLCIKVTL